MAEHPFIDPPVLHAPGTRRIITGFRMAFTKTIPQMRAGTKTVTRRDGWDWLCSAVSDTATVTVTAIEKGQGLKKGEHQVVIRQIEIFSAWREELGTITPEDCVREGFPELSPAGFVAMFGKPANFVVTRIAFRHLFGTEPP